MIITKPSVELVGGNVGIFNRARHVELCGRVCYKSEAKITEDSAEKFIAGIIKRGHEAVLEHARVTLDLSDHPHVWDWIQSRRKEMNTYEGVADYLTSTDLSSSYAKIISGNMRAWRNLSAFAVAHKLEVPAVIKRMWAENAPFFPEFFDEDAPYIGDTLTDINPCPNVPTFDDPALRLRHSWYTLRFICDRGVTHEIVRHRPASYCQESTRYCNYSKGAFGRQITVIAPCFLRDGSVQHAAWKTACMRAEAAYLGMLELGCTPQEARDVLPNSLKTELVMTATADEWLHFLELRTSEAAHPQMREVATLAREILVAQDPEVFGDGEQ